MQEELQYRILIVDPDPDVLDLYRGLFQPLRPDPEAALVLPGFDVVTVNRGEGGLACAASARARGRPFHLALVALESGPDTSGIHTALALRGVDPSLYLVLCVRAEAGALSIPAVLEGDLVVLRKPFDAQEVCQLARTLCRSWLARDRMRGQLTALRHRLGAGERGPGGVDAAPVKALAENERRYRAMFEGAPEGIWVIDPQLRTLDANLHLCRMLGYGREDLIGQTPLAFVDDENRAIFERQTARIDQVDRRSYEIALRHRDGRRIPTLFNAMTLRDGDGRVSAAVAFVTDLTERQRTDERLRQTAVVFDNAAEGVMVTDAATRILSVNRAFCDITGYTEAEVQGQTPALLRSGRHDRQFYQAMWDAILTNGYWRGEVWNRRKGGEVYPEWLTVSSVRDQAGRLSHFVAVFSDISAMKRTQAELERLAHHDPLTDLPNRLLFNA
ncbi:MAG TPA: PAS domain S-box protein, partial [Lamprocystis sp. (in: g-proteobacteria)]|nr:PAS domain S-box protein [Lamprocystis sp. (in: g-proteobacteria)]